MIDSHCHLEFAEYGDDRAAVLTRARHGGVTAFICIGSGRDLSAAQEAVALAAAEPDVFAAVGVHPHDAATMTEEGWRQLDELARAPRVVGVGESGLDYHYDHSPRPTQREVYARSIRLARAAGRPLVSHVRDAHDDAVEILRAEGAQATGGVIHCFTGGVEDA